MKNKVDNRTGEAFPSLLEDAVHYGDVTKELYVKKVTGIYKQAKK